MYKSWQYIKTDCGYQKIQQAIGAMVQEAKESGHMRQLAAGLSGKFFFFSFNFFFYLWFELLQGKGGNGYPSRG